MREYNIISADAHLEVNPETWKHYIPAKYREHGPQLIDNPGAAGGKAWTVPGGDIVIPLGLPMCGGRPFDQFKPAGWSYDDAAAGLGDAKSRVAEQDIDGVDAEVLYPGVHGPRLYVRIQDKEAQRETVAAYNRFLSDFCDYAPDRFVGIGILPQTGIDDAIAELERLANLKNIRAVMPSNWPTGKEYPTEEDDRFWAAAQEIGMPISAHVNFGAGPVAYPMMVDGKPIPGGGAVGRMAGGCPAPAGTCSQLIGLGILDRFPDLQFIFAETGAGWVPYWLEQMDDRYMRHRHYTGIKTKLLPSDYFRRQIALTFMIDRVALTNLDGIGEDNVMWSSDFPHAEGDWPNSRRVIKEQFVGVDPTARHKILAGNAVRLYKLDA